MDMREYVSRQAVAIADDLKSRGLRVVLDVDEGDWSFEDFSLFDSYFTDSWPRRPPIRIAISTDAPARHSAFNVDLLRAATGGVFWLIGDPPEPPAINVREPAARVAQMIAGEMGLQR